MFFYLADILGAQQQSLPVSYFWPMEALRYQSPSVVSYLVDIHRGLAAKPSGELFLAQALRYQSPSVVVPDTYICFPCSAEPLELLRGGGKAGDGFHEMVLASLYVQDKKTKE